MFYNPPPLPDMLPLSVLCTLTGPFPTPFTGNWTQAVQFLDDLDRLVWKNLNHPIVSTPQLRIDMALSFIYGPATETWKHGIRQTLHPELSIDIESLWDKFIDSFCEIWVHYTESTVPTVAPVTQIAIEDLLITLAAEEILPHHASGTINLTTDEDTDDWSPFAPRIPISPPSLVSILTLVKPVDEEPLLTVRRTVEAQN
ncbi:hypothetical protein EDB92DRAFT_1955365 [Lactarius akahatsu]|uniref:Uncharacterized protein n=1 Tax=Lactarius akahatsu TaxID=416441 RepID=A0AAD4L489_9AGAM|nr:hypothetical protein EDB92DRAFT_1955365 [Lactarius akahatsu]